MGRPGNTNQVTKLKRRKARKLLTQWKRQPASEDEDAGSRVAVAELFSPPRFKLEAEKHGLRGYSFDVLQGWDLTDKRVQAEVDRLLDRAKPDLLVACPPCKRLASLECHQDVAPGAGEKLACGQDAGQVCGRAVSEADKAWR